MMEDPEILTTEGSELTSTKGEEGTWLRPKQKRVEFSVDEEEEGGVGSGKHRIGLEQAAESSVDASYDDIDTLKSEEVFYRFSKGPNTPLHYGKMLPLFKRKQSDGYYVYLGPDCTLTHHNRAVFCILGAPCLWKLRCLCQIFHGLTTCLLQAIDMLPVPRTNVFILLAHQIEPRYCHREKN
jgi:hypothetical protein